MSTWYTNVSTNQQVGLNFTGGGLGTQPGAYNDQLLEMSNGGWIIATYTSIGTEATGDIIIVAALPLGQAIAPASSYIASNGIATAWTGTLGDNDQTQVAAISLVNGTVYTIYAVGTTNFTTGGAGSNTVGTQFTYNGAALTGTGIAILANNTRYSGSLAVGPAGNYPVVPTGAGAQPAGNIALYEVGGGLTQQVDTTLQQGTPVTSVTFTTTTITTPVSGKVLTFWLALVTNA